MDGEAAVFGLLLWLVVTPPLVIFLAVKAASWFSGHFDGGWERVVGIVLALGSAVLASGLGVVLGALYVFGLFAFLGLSERLSMPAGIGLLLLSALVLLPWGLIVWGLNRASGGVAESLRGARPKELF